MNIKQREIRSKATLQKGTIAHITNTSVWVDFGYLRPIRLAFDKFLELVHCEQKVEDEIRRKMDEIRDIRIADEDT